MVAMSASKYSSARRDRREAHLKRHDGQTFFLDCHVRRVPFTQQSRYFLLLLLLHPRRRDVVMHSAQKRCRHSIVVCVSRRMPRQTGHRNSLFSCRSGIDTVSHSGGGGPWIAGRRMSNALSPCEQKKNVNTQQETQQNGGIPSAISSGSASHVARDA